MNKNETQNISMTKSAAILTLVNVFSVIFSFIQEAVFANYYGTAVEADAYTIAIQIPVILFSVVTTAVQTVIIPIYSKNYYGKSKEEAANFACNFISIITIITLVIVCIFEIFADGVIYIFSPGLSAPIHDLAVNMSRIVFPTMIFTQLMAINAGILNVHKSFVLPALTSNILNTVFVVSVVFLSDKFGIYAAVLGNAVGIFCEVIYSIIIRRKWVKYRFILNFRDKQIKSAVEMMIPVFIGIGAAEINKIIDRIVASFLIAGSIASLSYASKLTSSVSTLLITGVSTVIYPQLAQKASQKDYDGLSETFNISLSFYILLILPIICGGFFLRKELISLVFERGAFSKESVLTVAPLFVCYLVCLLFTAFRQVSSRLFYSMGDSKTPMKNSLIGIGINIVLNIVLAYFFGAMGLAMATTISTAVISFLILKDAKKIVNKINYKKSKKLFLKVIIASLVMLLVLFITKKVIQSVEFGYSEEFIFKALYTVCMILVGAIVYICTLLILKTDEVKLAINMVIKRRKK